VALSREDLWILSGFLERLRSQFVSKVRRKVPSIAFFMIDSLIVWNFGSGGMNVDCLINGEDLISIKFVWFVVDKCERGFLKI
jgi:hypothetical protein